jgi:hypothetical protein
MKKLITFFLLCWITFNATAQVYRSEKQLSPGIANDYFIYFTKSVKGKFYYLDKMAIHKYENGILFNYPDGPKTFTLSGYDSVMLDDLEEFQGNVYIAAYHRFKVGTDTIGICYFDGTSWKPVVSSKNLRALRLCAAGNFLYITDYSGDLYKMDASHTITKIRNRKSVNIRDMIIYNKTEITWIDSFNIYKYNGNSFDSIPNKYKGLYSSVISDHDSDIYVRQNKYLFKMGKTFGIQLLDSSSVPYYVQFIGKINNYLYARTYNSEWKFQVFDLNTKKFIDILNLKNDGIKGSYNKIYSKRDDYSVGGKCKLYEVIEAAVIEGNIYNDLNRNCVKNKGETAKQKTKVVFSNGTETQLAITNDTGYFVTGIVPGNYAINIEKKYIQILYDSCGGTKTYSAGNTYKLNIPYRFIYPKKDVAVSFVSHLGSQARRGFQEGYNLVYNNLGSTDENIKLVLEYPDSLTFISSDLNPTSHVGRKLTFEIKNVLADQIGYIFLKFHINAKKQLNSGIRFIAYTDAFSNDLDSSDNRDTLDLRTVAAIDPNLKESYPDGLVKNPVSKIKYHIQFQNEGNYYATRVVVVDTIDRKLPLTKLQMIGTKHPYTLRVENGNVLIWEFDNIQLMPKSMDEYASRGYISFEAPLARPLNYDESVKNRAHIYFDYEDPLATPYAIVGVGKDPNSVKPMVSSKHSISVFPNPSQEQFNIQAEGQIGSIKVFDMMGRLILSQRIQNAKQILEVGNWSKGIYILHFEDKGISMKLVKE